MVSDKHFILKYSSARKQVGADNTRYAIKTDGTLLNRDIDYSKNDGWEVGIKISPTDWLAARLSY